MTGPEVTQPDPGGGVEMTSEEYAAFRGESRAAVDEGWPCMPSIGESCGNCHRCTGSEATSAMTPKTLHEMQADVRAVNEANGWHDTERTFGDTIALLHSEVSEAFEAYRDWGLEDMTIPRHVETCIGTHGAGEHCSWLNGPMKPEGVGSEFADILIRLLDSAERHGIDLEAEYQRKLAHNRTRGYRHGGKRI